MCGLISVHGENPTEHVMKQYLKQYTRGEDGFGFLALKKNRIVQFARATTEAGIRKQLEIAKQHKPDAILFHHRFPTSTINVVEAAHPLPVVHSKWKHNYFVLHNGVIMGADEQVDTIERRGYSFASRVQKVSMYRAGKTLYEITEDSEVNDSEVLGFYIGEYLEGKRKDIPVLGAIAAIVVQQDKATGRCTTYFMRNYGNPLVVERDKEKGIVLIASEAKGYPLPAHQIMKMTRSTALAIVEEVSIGKSYAEPSTYTGYSHYSDINGRRDYESAWEHAARRKPGLGFDTETGSLLPADVPPRSIPTKEEAKGDNAIIERAIQTARDAADLAYTDYEEAQGIIESGSQTEAERIEMQEYIEELRQVWVSREEELENLLEENGQEYESTRYRSADALAA